MVVWLPALLVGLALALPLAYLLIRGAGATDEAWTLLFRARTAQILGRSALLAVLVTTISVAIAVPLAWLTTRTDLPLRRFWSVAVSLPLVVPSYVGGFIVVSALGPKGLLQGALSPLGVDRLPDIYGAPGAAITLSVLSYPYVLLTVRGALLNLDPALEESARGLGARPLRTFLRVTLPQLRPAIGSGGLLVALYTLSDFGAVSLLRYETFTWAIYQQYQSALDRSAAALLSLVLVALAIAVLVAESYSRGRGGFHRSSAGAQRPHAMATLGRWKWPALGFCALVLSAGLLLPMAVLAYWLVKGLAAGEELALLWVAARNSLYVSGLAAVVTVACAIPIATLIVRYPGGLSRAVKSLSFVIYALPGVVVALALVFFGASFARPVYQTTWLLLLAYVVLFLPVALGATRSSLLQINPALEDAARGLGYTASQTLRAVVIPLLRPGIAAGALLVFLVTMKELPATLILGPLEFKTLATAIWSASSEAFFARAAAPALMLVVLASVPTALLMVRRDGRLL